MIVHEHLRDKNLTRTFASRAASYAFQKSNLPSDEDDSHQVTLSSSAILKYVGIGKHDGLVSVERQLLEGGRISSPLMPLLTGVLRYTTRQYAYLLAEGISSR